jgi:HAD superfamily hydrolase (TIGR01509 family)
MNVSEHPGIAVLFDMDGTLVDTENVGPQLMGEMFDDVRWNATSFDPTLFLQVWRRLGDAPSTQDFVEARVDEADPFLKAFYDEYVQRIIEAPTFEGATLSLQECRERGYKTAVVSASTREQIKAVVDRHQWAELLDLVLSQDEYMVKKPDPCCWLMAAQRLGVQPGDCLVVEDSLNGALAAKAAGMLVIGVMNNSELERIDAAPVDAFARLPDIPQLAAGLVDTRRA